LRRHIPRAEVGHIRQPGATTLRHAGLCRRINRVGPRSAPPAIISPLGGGYIQHTIHKAITDQHLHRLPADAGGMNTSTS
jgi:hypothetical protein